MPRRATQTDIDVMVAIHASAFPAKEAWSRDVFSLQLALPNVVALVDPEGGLIVSRVAADEAEILTLAVTPEARRSGIGSALLAQATNLSASDGARAVFLEFSAINIAARQLYSKAGFVEVGVRRNYYSDHTDALVLRLDLETKHSTKRL